MSAAFVYAPALAEAELRPDHPLKPRRAATCFALLEEQGLFAAGAAQIVAPRSASRDDILRVHEAAYVKAVERLSRGEMSEWEAHPYGFASEGDNPPFPGMYDYHLLVCGAAIEAVRLVDEGTHRFAFMPAGGVNHHALPGRASGFGVFNDVAVAIAWLLERGQRVMYLDLDVHHGDGVEATFAADARVLTVSIHESTRTLFPGPKGGFPENIGHGAGAGYAVNVPLAPYTDTDTWLWAIEELVPTLYQSFAPDLLLVQLGADGYHGDPLAHLLLTTQAYEAAAQRLRDLTGGRLAAVGGGGYDVAATPRIWAIEFTALAGLAGDPAWHDAPDAAPTLSAASQQAVRTFAEHSVAAVKRNVFPYHR